MDLISKQLQREREDLKRGLREQFKKNRDDAGRCYFSNTEKGIQFRNACLLKLRDALMKDHESLTAGTFRSEKEKMIRTVMDVVSLLKPQKSQDPEFIFDTKGDIFDIIAHVTLTAFIAVTSATPIDSPQRNSVINLTDGAKFGQSIADHLKDPSKVGQAW